MIVLIVLSACSQFRASDAKIAGELEDAAVVPSFKYLTAGGRSIRYMVVGGNDMPRVLFIHGAPGSLDMFNPYFESPDLRAAAQLVSVDRPGYGYSNYGLAEPEMARQSELVGPLVVSGTIIVGHSYGGTLAMRLAMDYPDRVRALVLIAPSLSPDDERIFFFNRPMERRALNWMMSGAWKVSNTEKLAQVANLEAMESLWSRVRAPVTLIHGTRDRMVPITHSEFAVARLEPDATRFTVLEGETHFIVWSEQELITEEILRYLE